MRTTCYDAVDILVVHLFDKPIVREVSQGWLYYRQPASTEVPA